MDQAQANGVLAAAALIVGGIVGIVTICKHCAQLVLRITLSLTIVAVISGALWLFVSNTSPGPARLVDRIFRASETNPKPSRSPTVLPTSPRNEPSPRLSISPHQVVASPRRLPNQALPPWQQVNDLQAYVDDVTMRYYRAVAAPENEFAEEVMRDLHACENRLDALPDPPGLEPIFAAEKYRRLAMVTVLQARIWRERKYLNQKSTAINIDKERLKLARKAIDAVTKAKSWLGRAHEPSAEAEIELRAKIGESEIEEHLENLKATAYAILWEVKRRPRDRMRAEETWNDLPADYQRKYYPPAPELAYALGLPSSAEAEKDLIFWGALATFVIAVAAVFYYSGSRKVLSRLS